MINTEQINIDTDWGTACASLNKNTQNIALELETVKRLADNEMLYFVSEELLKALIPKPRAGQIAYVGTPFPGIVWSCQIPGAWMNTNVPAVVGPIDDERLLHKEGSETITGQKTFNLPVIAVDAKADNQLATLKQVKASALIIENTTDLTEYRDLF